MKLSRILLLGILVVGGAVASAAPIFAATHGTRHSAPYVLDDKPTPTPTPFQRDGDDCSAGC